MGGRVLLIAACAGLLPAVGAADTLLQALETAERALFCQEGVQENRIFSWRTPAVLEQYSCYLPIDASAAKLIRTYLALYAAEGRALDLAKARALGDAMVNNQDESGRIRTYWIPEAGDTGDPLAGVVPSPLGGDWYNCMAEDMRALAELVGTFPNGVQKGTTR